MSGEFSFQSLVEAIQQVHDHCATQVKRTVNVSLTLRNWVIGGYIHHYERDGQDRASYGEGLVDRLASQLADLGLTACDRQRLYSYITLFRAYPQIGDAIPPGALPPLPIALGGGEKPIVRSLTGESAATGGEAIVRSPTGLSRVAGHLLLERLSFTHLELLAGIDDPLKRAFYETACMRGNWSVRALKRQLGTLYYERSGLSRDKEKLAAMIEAGAETAEPNLAIRDPYIFEFLGLRAKDAVAETDLEAALVENLREFLLELGHGFCLEAQQKSILMGKTRGYVDLVFYHRILKCHVLIELKVDAFSHEHLGQLNTYVSWYRANVMTEGDNPPIGLLLCTDKDHVLVEYALAGLDNRLFVSKYQLELPSTAELRRFLEQQRREVEG